MNSDLKQRLATAAKTDNLMLLALYEIEFLESRQFEKFPAYWHERMHLCNDPQANDLTQYLCTKARGGDALATDTLAERHRLIRRTFDELKALAWHRGWIDGCDRHAKMYFAEVVAYAKEQYPLAEQQSAYLRGSTDARLLCSLTENVDKRTALLALLERYQTHASLQ